jgi:5-methylcytosine-specific restriction endonuclease McrA
VNDVGDVVTWRVADETLRTLAGRRAGLDVEEAKWLVIAQRERVHVELGLGSFREYVERVLGYAPHTAIERIRVAEELVKLPALRAALAEGRCSYSALREVTRVATPENEAQWLAAIGGKSARDIEPMVRGRQKGDAPDAPRDPDLQPHVLRLEVPPEVFAMFREARKVFESERDERLDDAAVFAELCRRGLRGGDTTAPTHQIALMVCPECGAGSQDAAGRVVDVAPETVAIAECDAQRIGRVDGDVTQRLTTDIPAPTRRAVERRDRGRCTVPGCGASRFLEIHHIVHVEHGGGHALRNLTLLCGAHHRRHHAGKLQILGEAPRLTFRHADGSIYGGDCLSDAKSALRNLGWSREVATDAVERAAATAAADLLLPDFIIACIRECSPLAIR